MVNRINWLPFVPPWNMPDLLRTIDGLLYFQDQLPFPMFSNTSLEALACGTTILNDSPDILEGYRRHGVDLGNFTKDLPLFTLLDPKPVNSVLTKHFAKQEDCVAWECTPAFNQYVSFIERVFLDAIEEHP